MINRAMSIVLLLCMGHELHHGRVAKAGSLATAWAQTTIDGNVVAEHPPTSGPYSASADGGGVGIGAYGNALLGTALAHAGGSESGPPSPTSLLTGKASIYMPDNTVLNDYGSAEFASSWSDVLTIQGASSQYYNQVFLSFKLHGSVLSQLAPIYLNGFIATDFDALITVSDDGTPVSHSSFYRTGQSGWSSYSYNNTGFGTPSRTSEFTGTVLVALTLQNSDTGAATGYSVSLLGDVDTQTFTGNGLGIGPYFAGLDVMDTISLDSITLYDPVKGYVTPESLGYTLTFDSGMQSPNAGAVVPEPASIILLLLGGLSLLACRPLAATGPL